MTKEKLIIVFMLFLSIMLLSLKINAETKVMVEDVIQNTTTLVENKNHDNTHKPEKTKNASESSIANSHRGVVSSVSMIRLIANPEKYDGKYVRIIGFVSLEFEGNAIYLHEDDYKHGLSRNGLWLNISEGCCGKDLQMFDRKYVLVEGTFNSKNQGHMSLASGAIENIKRFQLWVVKRDGEDID